MRSRHYRQIVTEAALGLTPTQAAIAFALAQPQINADNFVGIRSQEELAENLPAVTPLPAALLNSCTPCGWTMKI